MADILEKITNEISQGADDLQYRAEKARKGVSKRIDGYLDGTYDPKAHAKKNAVKGATTALVVLSLLSGLAFSGPQEITEEQSAASYNQAPIVMDIDDYMSAEVDDGDDDADEQKTAKGSLFARFRQAVLSLPQSVRILIIVPLWAIGTALMTAVSVLWNVIFASPLGAFIASFALGFAILTGLFAATAKMLFPDVPLSRILQKRNILILGITALMLSAFDALAPLYWNKYPLAAAGVKLVIGASVIGALSVRAKKLFNKDLLSNKYSHMPQAVTD